MKTEPPPGPPSAARLKANLENAKKSTGPKTAAGKERSRLNALKHGITARVACPGENPQRSLQFFQAAWTQAGPRNPLEEICVANLLNTRLKEYQFADKERLVLTRKPLFVAKDDDRLFPFYRDADGLRALEHLTRLFAHLTRTGEKALLALLRVRQEDWGERCQNGLDLPGDDCFGTRNNPDPAALPHQERKDDGSQPAPGSLEECLADKRVVLPCEREQDYEALARGLWSTLQPANLLEGFIAADLIQTQWRLDRVLLIQEFVLHGAAISLSGHYCGFGFAFIQDCQGKQALDPLRGYESVLLRRLEKRQALFRKVRAVGWTDNALQKAPAKGPVPAAIQPVPEQCSAGGTESSNSSPPSTVPSSFPAGEPSTICPPEAAAERSPSASSAGQAAAPSGPPAEVNLSLTKVEDGMDAEPIADAHHVQLLDGIGCRAQGPAPNPPTTPSPISSPSRLMCSRISAPLIMLKQFAHWALVRSRP